MHDAQKPETTATTDFQRPNVIFQLKTREGVQDGINLIVDGMRPTHGPLPRTVAPTRNGFAKPFPQTIPRLSSPPLHQHPSPPPLCRQIEPSSAPQFEEATGLRQERN